MTRSTGSLASLLKVIMNGVSPVEEWTLVLYAIVMAPSARSQFMSNLSNKVRCMELSVR